MHCSLGSKMALCQQSHKVALLTPLRCSCVASLKQRRICLHQLACIDSFGGWGPQCWPLLISGVCWEPLANTGGCLETNVGWGDTELHPCRVSSFLALGKQVSDYVGGREKFETSLRSLLFWRNGLRICSKLGPWKI